MGIAHLLSEHASGFHALAGKASVFHVQFVQNLRTCAASYAGTEGAIRSALQGMQYGKLGSIDWHGRLVNVGNLLLLTFVVVAAFLYGLLYSIAALIDSYLDLLRSLLP